MAAPPRARLRHRVPKHHPASVAPVSSLGGPVPKFKTLLGLGSLGLGSVGSQPPREPAPKPGLVLTALGALLPWCPPAMAGPAALGVAEGTQPQQGERKPGSQHVIFLSRSSNSHFTPNGTFSRIKLFFQSLCLSAFHQSHSPHSAVSPISFPLSVPPSYLLPPSPCLIPPIPPSLSPR